MNSFTDLWLLPLILGIIGGNRPACRPVPVLWRAARRCLGGKAILEGESWVAGGPGTCFVIPANAGIHPFPLSSGFPPSRE